MKHRAIFLMALSTGIAMAQPAPTITGGPVNAASYARTGLPNAGIAQGAMFVVFGNNLGPAAIQTVSAFPLQPTLAGTSIQIQMAGSTFNAIMIYTVSSQVAAIVPSSTPTGDGTLAVSFNGQTSASVPIHIVANSFGIFTRNQAGSGPAIVFNFNSQTDQPVNSLIQAAQPAQILTIWGTGLGAVSGDETAGPLPGDLNVPVDVFIGNKPANIMYRGRSGCCAGIDQIVTTVPAGVQGCSVSLAVRVAGVVSNFTTIAVAPTGNICSDPGGFSVADLTPGGGGGGNQGMRTAADIVLSHVTASAPGLGTIQSETAEGHFRRYSNADLLASTRGSVGGAASGFPSPGSCLVYPFPLDPTNPFSAVLPKVDDPVSHLDLDAGAALNLSGPRGVMQITRRGTSQTGPDSYQYKAKLGGYPDNTPIYLDPGNYTLDSASGGTDVGSVHAALTIPSSPPVWSNPNAFSNISRSQDQTITWSGGAPGGLVAVLGASADPKPGGGNAVLLRGTRRCRAIHGAVVGAFGYTSDRAIPNGAAGKPRLRDGFGAEPLPGPRRQLWLL